MRGFSFAPLLALLLWLPSTADAAKRVALVIGNDSYAALPKLQKAVNDAKSVAEALRELEFKVIEGHDLGRRDMNARLRELESSIEPGDEVFFFFAGHGVAIGADNYLIPVDMAGPKDGEEALVADEAMNAGNVIRRVQGRGAAVAFVVLDACRDNPFAAAGARNIGSTRGLARIDAPTGVFVLYSANFGQAALDRLSDEDQDPNSIFTRKLVPLLQTPGMSHVKLAKAVQSEVAALAATVQHTQEPAYSDQIRGEIILKPAVVEAAARQITIEPAKTPEPSITMTEAATAWVAVKDTDSPALLELYIARFKGTVFSDLARVRLEEIKKSRVAALEPVPPSPPKIKIEATPEPEAPAVKVIDLAALASDTQSELARLGCYAGKIDGKWGKSSRAAVAEFNSRVDKGLDAGEPSEENLAALKAINERVCPLVCEAGFAEQNNVCVAAVTEPAGDAAAATAPITIVEEPAAPPKIIKRVEEKPRIKVRKTPRIVIERQPKRPRRVVERGGKPTCKSLDASGYPGWHIRAVWAAGGCKGQPFPPF